MRKPKRPDDAPLTKAMIYCRVSSATQARDGISLDAQEAACRAFAAQRGLEVVGVYVDAGISGRRDENGRQGLARLLDDYRGSTDTAVLVYSLSRLGRSQSMIWRLIDDRGEHRLRVTSVTEPFDVSTAMGRAFLGLLATFAQLHSDLTGENTRDALAYARSIGTKLGAPSMIESTDEDGRRVVDLGKVELVRRVHEVAQETGSMREIAKRLNERGIPSVRGAKWHPRTVKLALGLRLPDAVSQ